jgi:APA family basic amino acid/polyamine antiporter
MPSRRRQHGLERVLGSPALSSTAYGDVGSSIYYALGVTASLALGLTPLVFVIAGIFFLANSFTYAEGTVRFPEAGGSSSFARHAFNEVASFLAAWAQMLNYVVTISISAYFVPHYLSVFYEPLRHSPGDIIGGIVVVLVLVLLNILGVREAVKLNIVLAIADFSTQLLLVIVGGALVFHPHILISNVHFGVVPHWSKFLLAIPIGMIAYTGLETISNLAEETRDPPRDVPRAYSILRSGVFAIYLTLPAIALMALPVRKTAGGQFQTKLGLDPSRGGFKNDPVLGLVSNVGLHGVTLNALKIYVGLLAGTILIVATNAGVIGSSRISYAMSSYRQIPNFFRRLHVRLRTPWLSLIFFSATFPILLILPGLSIGDREVNFLGTMYSFGAMLSFAIANLSLIALRYRHRAVELAYKSRPNLRLRGVDWPLFAIVGLMGTAAAWLSITIQESGTRIAGTAWLLAGFALFIVYRTRVLRIPLRLTTHAPAEILPWQLEYQQILVPVFADADDGAVVAMNTACRLAAERRSRITVVAPLEVPLGLPIGERIPDEEAQLDDRLDEAEAIAESYGVRTLTRLVRTRNAAEAILAEAEHHYAEIIVLPASRPSFRRHNRRMPLDATTELVLKRATCRVLTAVEKGPARPSAYPIEMVRCDLEVERSPREDTSPEIVSPPVESSPLVPVS